MVIGGDKSPEKLGEDNFISLDSWLYLILADLGKQGSFFVFPGLERLERPTADSVDSADSADTSTAAVRAPQRPRPPGSASAVATLVRAHVAAPKGPDSDRR